MKTSCVKETEQQIRTASQSGKAAVEHGADLFFVSWASIAQMLLDVPMTIFFRIELGCIRWQELLVDLRVPSQIGLSQPPRVSPGSVPDQNHFASQMLLQMLKTVHNLIAMNRSFKMSLKDLARQGERHRGRDCAPVRVDLIEDGSTPAVAPSGRGLLLKGETKFIPEHDFGAQPLRLFLSWANRDPAKLALAHVPVQLPAAAVSVRCTPTASRAD